MTTFVIGSMTDILRLEAHIRTLLQCQSTQCAFLQSNEYISLKRSLLLRIAGVISYDGPIRVHIPKTCYVISVAESEPCVSIEEVQELDASERKRKMGGQTKIERFQDMIMQRKAMRLKM